MFVSVFKYLLLQFLPKAFASLPVIDFGWPGIDITLFGETCYLVCSSQWENAGCIQVFYSSAPRENENPNPL